MHLITALGALMASLIPSILARSIPSNTRYRAASLGPRKSGLQEHPSIRAFLRIMISVEFSEISPSSKYHFSSLPGSSRPYI